MTCPEAGRSGSDCRRGRCRVRPGSRRGVRAGDEPWARASGPVIQTGAPSPLGIFPSAPTASFSVTAGRPSVTRSRWPSMTAAASSASTPSSTSMPGRFETLDARRPSVRGSGSRRAITARAGRAAAITSAQGGAPAALVRAGFERDIEGGAFAPPCRPARARSLRHGDGRLGPSSRDRGSPPTAPRRRRRPMGSARCGRARAARAEALAPYGPRRSRSSEMIGVRANLRQRPRPCRSPLGGSSSPSVVAVSRPASSPSSASKSLASRKFL